MIYLFYSSNSFNSILSLSNKTVGGGSNSIVEIAEEMALDKVFLIEKNPSSFPLAFNNLGKKLVYGIEFIICENIEDKVVESVETEHKVIILAKDGASYNEGLMKLYSISATEGDFGGQPRLDFKTINENWCDGLVMIIPFYDSFLYNNLLLGSRCNISLTQKPIFCIEDHDLPYDAVIKKKVRQFAEQNNCETLQTHKVLYKRKFDIVSYQTYRCIQNKSSMEKPNLEGFASKNFNIV
jgi:DNA polymerase III alpha subunit